MFRFPDMPTAKVRPELVSMITGWSVSANWRLVDAQGRTSDFDSIRFLLHEMYVVAQKDDFFGVSIGVACVANESLL